MPKSHVVKYALISSVLLIIYFHFTQLVGLANRMELKLLNGVIFGIFLYIMLHKERIASGAKDFKYLNSFASGMYYAGIIAVVYTTYLVVYLKLFNSDISETIHGKTLAGEDATLGFVVVTTTMAALGSGIVLTFAFLQLLKNRHRNITEKEHEVEEGRN